MSPCVACQRAVRWNRNYCDYFKANYLSAKLTRTTDPPAQAPEKGLLAPSSRSRLQLPADVIVAVTGAEHLVVLEYIAEQILRRVVLGSLRRPP